MAHLLGSKTCIDSLRIDVDDLQNIIHDIIGKTGSIKCHSWKFPDKFAIDVDINELLERYQYGKNETDNQVSHIVLFEIIIDRLLLVLHGSWRFLYEIQTKLLPNTIDSSSTINHQISLSIGLVVKKYWNKLLHIFTILQQQETNYKRLNSTTTLIQTKSKFNNEKSCQTIETSFSPCSSCIKLQQYFRDYSDNIINLCHIYNLPSSLAHYRCSTSIIPEWLSLNDINNWFEYQSKDFDCLSKHFEYLNTTLNKTKDDLDLNEKICKQQNETNQHLQQIINDEKQSKKLLEELHKNKIIEITKEYDQYKLNLNEQIKLLTRQKTNIEQQLKDIQDECNTRGEELKKLEPSKNELKILTEERLKSDNLIKVLEQDCIRLKTELDVIKHDLEERNYELQKERLRIEKMIRQEENSQSKQKILVKSNDELSQECQSLKKQINELELERNQLEKSLQIIQKQNQSSSDNTIKVQTLMETNNHVLQEVVSLKTNIEQLHQQMNEREQILLKHHDLNKSLSTSNNLINNMQKQRRTNELQIDLLQKQNDSLKTSLDELILINNKTNLSIAKEEHHEQLKQEQSHRRYSFANETVTSKPKQAPLWLLNNEILEQEQAFTETKSTTKTNSIPRFNRNDYNTNEWIKSDSDANIETLSQQYDRSRTRLHSTDLLLTGGSRTSTVAHSSRALNRNRTSITPSSSSHHKMILNKDRAKTAIVKYPQQSISSAKAQNLSFNIIHRCMNCNKSFDDKRTYDIHKLSCRT